MSVGRFLLHRSNAVAPQQSGIQADWPSCMTAPLSGHTQLNCVQLSCWSSKTDVHCMMERDSGRWPRHIPKGTARHCSRGKEDRGRLRRRIGEFACPTSYRVEKGVDAIEGRMSTTYVLSGAAGLGQRRARLHQAQSHCHKATGMTGCRPLTFSRCSKIRNCNILSMVARYVNNWEYATEVGGIYKELAHVVAHLVR